jgi:GT2 family glycosyltransferase
MDRQLPHFSIVVPTYNRPEQLAACLRALAHLDYPRERFEVIVVDDGSEEPLDAVVEPRRGELALALVRQSNSGPAAARNTAAAMARGEFLAFTDDDCAPCPNWLRALAGRFRTTPEALIGGRTVNILTDNVYAAASQVLTDYLYEFYNGQPGRAVFFTSNNMSLPAATFHAAGGFDPTFPRAAAEDRDFCARLGERGCPLIYAPEAEIRHAHELCRRRFWRQHFHYGRGARRFRRKSAQRGASAWRPEMRFYRDLFMYPFRRKDPVSPLRVTSLLFESQVAHTLGFLCETFGLS